MDTGRALLDAELEPGIPLAWEQVEKRVSFYLQALGVCDSVEQERLLARVRRGFETRSHARYVENPLERALTITERLLDDWLAIELELGADRRRLLAARAALLGGAAPGWTARWAGISEESLIYKIMDNLPESVPSGAPLVMEPAVIELCCWQWGMRLINKLRRWLHPTE